MVIAQLLGDHLRLALPAGTEGAAIHLDQPHDIRLHRLDKISDFLEIYARAPQIPCIGEGKMKTPAIAGGITDIVQ